MSCPDGRIAGASPTASFMFTSGPATDATGCKGLSIQLDGEAQWNVVKIVRHKWRLHQGKFKLFHLVHWKAILLKTTPLHLKLVWRTAQLLLLSMLIASVLRVGNFDPTFWVLAEFLQSSCIATATAHA